MTENIPWLDKISIDKDESMENYVSIKRYLRKIKNETTSEATLRNQCVALNIFAKWCDKDFSELDEDDIYDYFDYLESYTYERNGKIKHYSETSIYLYKMALKKFLRIIEKEGLSKLIKCKNPATKKLPEDILSKEDIEKLLSAARNPRDKALIATLYESGARKGELFSVRLKHIVFDENGCIVTLPEGKTGARRVRLVFAASYLRQWIECHPTKDNRDSYLFVSSRDDHPLISTTALKEGLDRISKRAGVKKRVNPHAFRHARATHLAGHLTEQQMKIYLGWTENSSMASVYVHLSGKDIDDAILKMNGIIMDETHADGLRVGRCSRCKELNSESAMYCWKCGQPLREGAEKSVTTVNKEMEDMLLKVLTENSALKEELMREFTKLKG
ncbi:tyrosine-type recombinase/integrase [Methanosarcina acetivorans]|uniref:Integrase n=1 Tax=Methanosarcina acetivorans (strain ATCC 35395 / DSM 2834 / JCM 12185 / C2A) TaxID=188937 RepID=Q8TPS7_METAC|nr:tyrosine-type recombinase/integrase [Methanosarcina acetivorans]AAM05234.1 integrase [Methanosarcina acetivorans C2A]